MIAVILTGLYEFYSIVLSEDCWREKIAGLLFSLLISFIIYQGNYFYFLPLLTFLVIISLILLLIKFREFFKILSTPGIILGGVFYICLLLSHLILIRKMNSGREWLFFLMIVTFMGDTAAYYVGSIWGKHKLYAAVSPKKTFEGSAGGMIGSILGGIIFWTIFLSQLEIYHCLVLVIGISIMGQFGDLCESMIKRKAGVKDSGKLLPGHGGLLDRIDSIIFSGPFLYYYLKYIL